MKLNRYLESTLLKPTVTEREIDQLIADAIVEQFIGICVPPFWVKKVKRELRESDIQVVTVIGFPFGYSATEAKIAEIILAMVDGADELDVVANISAIKNGDWMAIADEINHIMPVIRSKGKIIKIIIESGVLTDDEIIKCCDIYGIAGIDYLKTSTGYAEKGASVEAVKLFRKYLPENVQIKASGGIRDYATTKLMIEAGATRIGCSAGVAIVTGAPIDQTKSNY